MADIMRVSRTVTIAMMRVLLMPLSLFIFEIDIVTEGSMRTAFHSVDEDAILSSATYE